MHATLQGGFQVFPRLCAALLCRGRGSTMATSTALQFSGIRSAETRNGAAATPSLSRRAQGSYWSLARRTSLMAQFQRVKTQFPDHLLLFQVGDFYELYGEDASTREIHVVGKPSSAPPLFSPLSRYGYL